jgi:replicative DNA helicase
MQIHNTIYADEYETLKQALGTLGELLIIIDDTPAIAIK